MQFEVADFEMAYNAFPRRPTLSKFMAMTYYAYLVLKMPVLNGGISIKGDVKRAYDYDTESCKTTDMLMASAELTELKKALAKDHSYPIMPEAKTSIHLEYTLSKTILLSPGEPSMVAHVGNSLDLK
jgi:hypothetical protein